MNINYNISSIIIGNNLANTDSALSKSIERLSSGYKINEAADSPSGIAMAKRMNAQLRGLSTASQSASDGISVIQTAEGALSEIQDMLQRLNELSVKAANGTMADSDRESVQEEVDALLEEIDRISESTEFNGSTLLNGNYDLRGYVEKSTSTTIDTSAITVESYSDEAKTGYYEVQITTSLNDEGETVIESVEITDSENGTIDRGKVNGEDYTEDVELENVSDQTMSVADDGTTVTITGADGFSLTLCIDTEALGVTNNATVIVDLTGIGAMTLQIGANEGQTLDVIIPTVSTKTLGVNELDVSTADAATAAIEKVSDAINEVSSIRARLGAYENRLEHTVSNLDVQQENMTDAYSRIMDVDMAEEMTEYSTLQVLSQAGISVLAQANDRPSQVLQLLQ